MIWLGYYRPEFEDHKLYLVDEKDEDSAMRAVLLRIRPNIFEDKPKKPSCKDYFNAAGNDLYTAIIFI